MKRLAIPFISAISACLLIFNNCGAYTQTPGSLDPGFSTDGKLTTGIGIGNAQGNCISIQSDGKILVAGYADNPSDQDFAITRYHTDGSLDNTFDADGIKIFDFGSSIDYGQAIAIQTDGKILVAGATKSGVDFDFGIVRLNPNGSIDNSFEGDGKLTTDIFGGMDDYVASICLQTDGKIVVVGYSDSGAEVDFSLARYHPDGSLDTTFDYDGKLTTNFASGPDYATSAIIQPDGKIVVAGSTGDFITSDFALARYNANGSLDNTFDSDGLVTTVLGPGIDIARSVTLQSDGKIVVGGVFDNGVNNDFAVVRYNSNGNLDNSFDADGIQTTDFSNSPDIGESVAIQSDQKIIVAGASGTSMDFATVAYNTNGSLDSGFDIDGKLTTDFGGSPDLGYAIAIQTDGKIVVAGYATMGGTLEFALTRYFPNQMSIDDFLLDHAVHVYPNPTIEHFTITIDENMINECSITITNLVGEILYAVIPTQQKFILNKESLGLRSGIYLVKLSYMGSSKVAKLIVE